MSQYAIQLLQTAVGYEPRQPEAYHYAQLGLRVIGSRGLAKLAAQFGMRPGQKQMTEALEATSFQFHRGFLCGLFDADGSVQGNQEKGG
jgi:ribonucleotide reductase class II